MEIIFILIVMILALKMNKNIGTYGEIRHFWNIQLMFVLGAITEIIWAVQNVGILELKVGVAWVLNGISLISFSILLYEWLRFIAHEVVKIEENPIVLIAIRIQLLVVWLDALITLSSVFTGWIYQIDVNAIYARGNLYWIHTIYCYSHWMWTTILILYYLRQKDAKRRRQLYDMLVVSMFPFVGGILCIIENRIPFLDASIILGTLLIFINLQEQQITTDALTGLNNRSNFMKTYDRLLNTAESHPFVLFVADIDKFKQINDEYGHLEGDHTLVMVANALRKLGSRYPSLYICRYGGDEFVLIAQHKDIKDPKVFVNLINATLSEENKKSPLSFHVTFSIGYQMIDNKTMHLKDAFEKADAMLYEKKRNK